MDKRQLFQKSELSNSFSIADLSPQFLFLKKASMHYLLMPNSKWQLLPRFSWALTPLFYPLHSHLTCSFHIHIFNPKITHTQSYLKRKFCFCFIRPMSGSQVSSTIQRYKVLFLYHDSSWTTIISAEGITGSWDPCPNKRVIRHQATLLVTGFVRCQTTTSINKTTTRSNNHTTPCQMYTLKFMIKRLWLETSSVLSGQFWK